MKYFRTK